jgi:hypothetical protein
LTLTGTTLAYEMYDTVEGDLPGEGSISEYAVVRDLTTGKFLHRVPTGTFQPPRAGVIGAGAITTIVVKRDGAAAWITDTRQASRYEVHVVDRNGARTVVSSSDISPHSLALGGSTIYWTQAGVAHSAPLL